jgi:hypothetical protein
MIVAAMPEHAGMPLLSQTLSYFTSTDHFFLDGSVLYINQLSLFGLGEANQVHV